MGFTKQSVEILWTKDYDDFSFYDKNREIDYNHCEKKIQESLIAHGWSSSFPMIVDGNLRIRDGQHRFIVAKKLGIAIPVLIVENFDDDSMFSINNASKKWTYRDFLHYHMQKGNKNAKDLYELAKKYKVTIRHLGDLAHFDKSILSKSNVTFPKDIDKKDLEKKIIRINEIVDIIQTKSERARASLVHFVEHPQYDHKHFLYKLDGQRDRIHQHTTVEGFTKMFQDIYNYRSTAKNRVIFTK